MIYTSDSMASIVEVMADRYRLLMDEDPEFLLMDDDSYIELKQDLYGEDVFKVELDMFRGMRVFHNDMRKRYIMVL